MDAPLTPNPMAPPRPMVPPGSTGMATTRPDSAGMKQRAHPQVTLATKMLESALKAVGATSEEGVAIMDAMTSLAKHFGTAAGDVTKQEMKMMGDRVNPTGAPGPENIEAMKQALSQKLQKGGMGAGAPAPGGPAGAPPPMPPAPVAA